jgi:hypothetical protein
MKTDDLIVRLAANASPVRPLPPPWKRATAWLGLEAAYVGAAVAVAMLRHRMAAVGDPILAVQQGALFAVAATAAVSAFASVIPGTSRRTLAAPLLPAGVWLLAVLWGCAVDWHTRGTLGLASQTDWPCVISIVVAGTILWAIVSVMLRRGAPVAPTATALLAAASALGIVNVEACLTKPHAFHSIVLLWHGAASALMLLVFVLAGRRTFRWPRIPALS